MKKLRSRNHGDKLLIVDLNHLLFKSIFVNVDLTYDDQFTGGIYGFIRQLETVIKEIEPTNVIVTDDHPPYLRKNIFSDYKGNRAKDPEFLEKLIFSREKVKEFLNIVGFQIYKYPGLEADDLIYMLASNYSKLFNQVVVASNDDDLYQLFKYSNVSLRKQKGILYTKENFKEDFDISVENWILACCMAGTHNNLKGLKRIGMKTAFKIVKGTHKKYILEEMLNSHETKMLIKNMRKCIELPFKQVELPAIELGRDFNSDHFVYFLEKLGISFSYNMLNIFEDLKCNI